MFKNLRTQLTVSVIAALILMLLSIWAVTRDYMILAVCVLVLICFYMIYLLFWFWKNVSEPIDRLTEFAAEIASGSYGSKLEDRSDNEIGQLTDAINDMSEKVAQAEKARTDFISQVSHELRTPLTAITGWSETIKFDPAVQGDSLRGINIISKEAERLTGMVTELLEFTRIQDGRFNLRIGMIDIAEELEDALFTYGKLMKQAGMDVNYKAPDEDIPMIPGDAERLKQVFLNLLDNAMIHGGDGKIIDVSLERDGGYVKIYFRDYGSGIPEAELPHVKEKFYKGSSKKSQGQDGYPQRGRRRLFGDSFPAHQHKALISHDHLIFSLGTAASGLFPTSYTARHTLQIPYSGELTMAGKHESVKSCGFRTSIGGQALIEKVSLFWLALCTRLRHLYRFDGQRHAGSDVFGKSGSAGGAGGAG